MSRKKEKKIKLLALYDFLRRETDENNSLSTAEIIEGLNPDGIAVELEVDNGLIDEILDRFGKDVNVAISSTL